MVLKRIRDIFVATINNGLDQVENPIVMLNQYLRDLETEISKARDNLIKQKALQENFKRRALEAERTTEKRQKQADLAFDAGEEDLARKALLEKKHAKEQIGYYEKLQSDAAVQIEEMQKSLAELEEKFRMLKDKKYALIARANAARTQEQLQVSLNKVHGESALKEIDRIEDRITEMEIRSKVCTGTWKDSTDRWAGPAYDEEVEKEIENMRAARQDGRTKAENE